MSHAWLITGPPGSGRSNAAIAFAAALQCESAGCGDCEACLTTLAGSHPDVTVRRTERMIISVDTARQWVRDSTLMPVRQRWQVIVVEDADRLHERANNALLKAIEEPTPRTVWMLCAPQPDDVLPTIRSRTRHVSLATPRPEERSEEHTSELQSRQYLVCRLLLEKKTQTVRNSLLQSQRGYDRHPGPGHPPPGEDDRLEQGGAPLAAASDTITDDHTY